jgi:hypothetical protein
MKWVKTTPGARSEDITQYKKHWNLIDTMVQKYVTDDNGILLGVSEIEMLYNWQLRCEIIVMY